MRRYIARFLCLSVVSIFAPLGVCSRLLAEYAGALNPDMFSDVSVEVAGIMGMVVSLVIAVAFLVFFFVTFDPCWQRKN